MSNIGKPVYFQDDKRKSFAPQWKLAEGSNIYRILPPFGKLAAKGLWSAYHQIHWGYTASNGKMRPFACIRRVNFKTKHVEQECPQCVDNYNREQFEKAEHDKYVKMGKHKDEIKKLLETLTDRRKKFNTEKRHFLNVMRQDGQIGVLKISNNAMKALRAEIKRLVETREAVDPVGITEGIELDFYRTGMDRDSTFKVSPVMEYEMVNGRRLQAIKQCPLTDEVLARMENEARELDGMFRVITRDQIQILVESEGDPETVDSVFGSPTIGATPAPVEDEADYIPDDDELVVSPATAASQLDEEAELLAKLEQLKSNRSKATPAPTQVVEELDPDAFLRSYKAGKL